MNNTFGSYRSENITDSHYETAPKVSFSGYDSLFAWGSVLMGFLFARALPIMQNSFGVTLIFCALFIFAGAYTKLSGVKISKKLIVYAIVIMMMSVGFITSVNKTLQYCLFVFIICALFYWIYSAFDLNGGILFGEDSILHAFIAVLAIPLRYVPYIFLAFVIKEKEKTGGKIMRSVLWGLLGGVCAVIPTLIIIVLLSYDKQFTLLIKDIFSFSANDVLEFIGDVVLGFIFSLPLFGAIFGSKHRKSISNGEGRRFKEFSCHLAPRAMLCAAVTPILIVYVIFFISQWDYYVSAFTKTLPDSLTYSEYAREGFFQLCWVCVINAVIMLLFDMFIQRNGKGRDPVRIIYSTLISLFTLVLVATALSKMILYIDFFGLTRKRVYSSWFIVLLALFFIAMLLRQYIIRLPMIRIMIFVFTVCFALIAVPDVDGMISTYNVNEYIEAELGTVDVDSISEYGASAVPSLIKLKAYLEGMPSLTDQQQTLLLETDNALMVIKKQLQKSPDHIFSFNISEYKAIELLKNIELE